MDYAALILTIFIIGYLVIIYEIHTRINKAATAVLLAGVTWGILFFTQSADLMNHALLEYVAGVSQIIFFLLAAMTLIEVMDAHKAFQPLNRYLTTRSKPILLCLISFFTFFLSAILDNLTTTILMISILRKLIPEKKERLIPLFLVVMAANAGGAWTPIGDVTTTMLWIQGKITTSAVIGSVFAPSVVALLIPLGIYLMFERGYYAPVDLEREKKEPKAVRVLVAGLLALIMVPVLKATIGMPPFMGILLGLSVVWVLTDWLHRNHEDRNHLKITHALTRIDSSAILFFLGILLSVDALNAAGLLEDMAQFMAKNLGEYTAVATAIGVVSAFVDNVPIVAASMGMYDYGLNHPFWLLLAFTAGTGGSILLIGSAAGVALMGLEKIDFLEYLKRASLPAFLGYLGGVVVYLLQG